jgi:O-antigen/teichoic acid export membrane protein
MIIVTVISFIANLILIPHYQALGASITVLATNALMTILGFYWASKTIDFNKKRIVSVFVKSLTGALLMGLIVFKLKAYAGLFLVVPLGAIIYFVLLYLLKAYRREDVVSIYNSFLRKRNI